jgi:hypothetical protein
MFFDASEFYYDRLISQEPNCKELLLCLRHLQCKMVFDAGTHILPAMR